MKDGQPPYLSVKKIFLTLIQPVSIENPLPIDDRAIDRMEELAKRHNLFPLLYVQLGKYNRRHKGNPGVQRYLDDRKTLFLTLAARAIRQEALEKEIILLLHAKDIPALVIKGNRLAKQIYKDPNSRHSLDIDILIEQGHVSRVDRLLTQNGFIRTDPNPIGFWISRLHHAQYRHPDHENLIEIHWNFGIPGFFNLDSKDIWQCVAGKRPENLELTPVMTLIHLLIHHHLHAFRELKVLLDIVWTAHVYRSDIDWADCSRELKRIGLVKTTRIALSQVKCLWIDTWMKSEGLKALDTQVLRLSPHVSAALDAYFKMELDPHTARQTQKDWLYFRLVLDRWPTILFSFFKTVLPFPEAIKAFYGDRRNWMLPMNYLRFMIWRVQERRE